ncbi:smg-9, nonsense mediated mRNA decay factor [Coemansia sp. RSA 2336]|nr:smg-9, nonsense mediated mRNA decay factor [Coemansia sp. RSA 2336]
MEKSSKRSKPIQVPRILVRHTNEASLDVPKPAPAPLPQPRKPAALPEPPKDVRGIKVPVISPTGKLLSTSVRRSLSLLRVRASIGVLGRSPHWNRQLISLLAGTPPRDQDFRGIDVLVTLTRMLLIDTPPLFVPGIADKWRRDSGLSRQAALRVYSLQVALWMLQICDTLLVAVDGKVDQDIVNVLVQAGRLVADIPGLNEPAAPNDFAAVGKCRLHLVVYGSDALQDDGRQLARLYQDATGICVSGVTVLQLKNEVPAMEFAKLWSDAHCRPLYSCAKEELSILGSGNSTRQNTDNCTISEESKSELRDQVLVPGSRNLWRNDEADGRWVSHCTRTWDSIRRSDQLQRLATRKPHHKTITLH